MRQLLYAAILFLVIRVTNDLPMHDNYLVHPLGFIVVEIAGVVAGSYLCFSLAARWVRLCIGRHISPAVEYACVLTLPVILALAVMTASHGPGIYSRPRSLVIPCVVTLLMSVWLYLTMKSSYMSRLYDAQRLKAEQSRSARLKAEMSMLRSQFHPHFLFNMLNTVYFTIDESNATARDTVEHLANLLRSQLYDGDSPVTLRREISALQSYIELSRIRHADTVRLTVDIDTRFSDRLIHPHLLLPLVENAFKHSSGSSPHCISICLSHPSPSQLTLTVTNPVSSPPSIPATLIPPTDGTSDECGISQSDTRSGLGLRNLRRRLDLLYPDGLHSLTFTTTSTSLTANLSITL